MFLSFAETIQRQAHEIFQKIQRGFSLEHKIGSTSINTIKPITIVTNLTNKPNNINIFITEGASYMVLSFSIYTSMKKLLKYILSE